MEQKCNGVNSLVYAIYPKPKICYSKTIKALPKQPKTNIIINIKKMSKAILIIVGLVILVVGLLSLFTDLEFVAMSASVGWTKVILGIILVILAMMDKKKPATPQV